MNCDDYLALLATLPAEELAEGRPYPHAANCPDCRRVTLVVAERERHMLAAYREVQLPATSADTAAVALRSARRRKVTLYSRIGLGLTTVGSILAFIAMTTRSAESPRVRRPPETIRLQCLSPEQAVEILRPYLGRSGSIRMRPNSPLGIVQVEATPKMMATVHKVLDRFDNSAASQCAVRERLPPAP